MALFDLPLSELRTYQAPPCKPADFDVFWQRTLTEARAHDLAPHFEPVTEAVYRLASVYDVTFRGWGGHPIKGWLLVPTGTTQRLPTVISYVGYGGGRGLPIDHLAPVAAGFAHFVMDTRGQGSVWSPGDTPDPAGSGPHHPGFMTHGVESPDTYYYRRVFTDAVRAIEAACTHPHVDPQRLLVAGGSQGGGIAIAAAALTPQVKLLAADVPFLCHIRRGSELTDRMPYAEIAAYLKCHRQRAGTVFTTLAYFDGVNFAPRIRARTLFSVGLMDMVCPPSTVFAAYNRIAAEKDIRVYDYNEHEGGGALQLLERLRWATQYL